VKVALLCNSPMGVPTLEFLVDQNLIAGVALPAVAHPSASRIVALADTWGLPVLRVTRDGLAGSLGDWLDAVQADTAWVMGFSYRLPPAVLERPRLGCFNFHPGRLPAYRGPDPLFWQIRRREPSAGLSVHRMDAGLDTGPLVHVEPVDIGPGDTYGMLLGRMAGIGARVAAGLAEALAARPGSLGGEPQDPAAAGYQPRPTGDDLIIDWAEQTALEIEALVRAANPYYGGALAFWRGTPIRIWQASVVDADATAAPGAVALAGEAPAVRCCDGALRLDVIGAEDGLFGGARFASVFGLQPGEGFTPPPPGSPTRTREE
jgi:methionyl-tRNA formyltransferase